MNYYVIKRNIKKIVLTIQTIHCMILSFLFPEKYVVYRASLRIKMGKVTNSNWGDDINPIMINFLSSKKPLFLPDCYLSKIIPIPNYLTIGSTLTFYPLNKTTVWGAGIVNNNEIDLIKIKPYNIYAVRGPMTRKLLIQKGIVCPEVYGDPALLFPFFYKPNVTQTDKIGIIPHFLDLEDTNVIRLLKNDETQMINVRGYDKWESFIDKILACKMIVSSSLHGLIIAEAYGIPAVWAKFGSYIDGWDFKYFDFYASIGKDNMKALIITDETEIDDLLNQVTNWKKGNIDLRKLIYSCPFIDEKIMNNLIKNCSFDCNSFN